MRQVTFNSVERCGAQRQKEAARPTRAASSTQQEPKHSLADDVLKRCGVKRRKNKTTRGAVRPGRSEPVLRRWEPAAAL